MLKGYSITSLLFSSVSRDDDDGGERLDEFQKFNRLLEGVEFSTSTSLYSSESNEILSLFCSCDARLCGTTMARKNPRHWHHSPLCYPTQKTTTFFCEYNTSHHQQQLIHILPHSLLSWMWRNGDVCDDDDDVYPVSSLLKKNNKRQRQYRCCFEDVWVIWRHNINEHTHPLIYTPTPHIHWFVHPVIGWKQHRRRRLE